MNDMNNNTEKIILEKNSTSKEVLNVFAKNFSKQNNFDQILALKNSCLAVDGFSDFVNSDEEVILEEFILRK